MIDDMELTVAGQQYAAAHAAHYRSKDVRAALELYKELIVAHGDTAEAGYSRSQIHNIAFGVVTREDLLSAMANLALAQVGGPREAES